MSLQHLGPYHNLESTMATQWLCSSTTSTTSFRQLDDNMQILRFFCFFRDRGPGVVYASGADPGGAKITPALLEKLGIQLVHTPLFSQTRKLPRLGQWTQIVGRTLSWLGYKHAKVFSWFFCFFRGQDLLCQHLGFAFVCICCVLESSTLWTKEPLEEFDWCCISRSLEWYLVDWWRWRVDTTGPWAVGNMSSAPAVCWHVLVAESTNESP